MNKKKVIIVGGGTSGAITSSFFKKNFKDFDVSVIKDSSVSKIGVGESTTPLILSYFNSIGLSIKKFLKETNSTIKIGIRFENWLLENDVYWHNFRELKDVPEHLENFNSINLFDIIENDYKNGGTTFSPRLDFDKKVPFTLEWGKLIPHGSFALHIDAEEFSEYVFKNTEVSVIDSSVVDVVVKNNEIEKLVLKNGEEVSADLYLDCTGFNRTLISQLDSEWESFSDTLSVNSAVSGRIYCDKIKNQVTIATAQDFGWIWQIPLKDRYGVGYVYDSSFADSEYIENSLREYCLKQYGCQLVETKKYNFDPGCLKKTWIGNCVAIGLSSGFIEPLESTNIHTIIYQTLKLSTHLHPHKNQAVEIYNKKIYDLQTNIKNFVKLHYLNRKSKNDFWIKSNICSSELKEKINCISDYCCNREIMDHFGDNIFKTDAYTSVLMGLNYLNKDDVKNFYNFHNQDFCVSDESKAIDYKQNIFNKYLSYSNFLENLYGIS